MEITLVDCYFVSKNHVLMFLTDSGYVWLEAYL